MLDLNNDNISFSNKNDFNFEKKQSFKGNSLQKSKKDSFLDNNTINIDNKQKNFNKDIYSHDTKKNDKTNQFDDNKGLNDKYPDDIYETNNFLDDKKKSNLELIGYNDNIKKLKIETKDKEGKI